MKRVNPIISVGDRPFALEDIKPSIDCGELPAFDPKDLDAVRRSFQNTTTITLRQAWREIEEADFAPGKVRFGWRATSLLIFAELSDGDIFNDATGHNQQTWLKGDTFEIFLRPIGQPAYVEFHVTPNNHRLQLRYPDVQTCGPEKRNDTITSALIHGDAFRSLTWIRPDTDQWFVYAEIPAQSVTGRPQLLIGEQWQFSFGRYDYQRSRRAPVLSSSSAHAQPDFHRQDEWRVMTFKSFVPDQL